MRYPIQLAAILALALAFSPLHAKNGADDYYGEIEHDGYDDSERLSDAQKAAAKAAEKNAKEFAKVAEKSAKNAAKAAKNEARGQSAAQRAAVAAEGKFLIEQAKLAYENRVLNSLLNLAEQASVDVSEIPDTEGLLRLARERAVDAKAFYELMVETPAAGRASAIATRSSELALEAVEQAIFISGLNELQFEVLEAYFELADEVIDVAEAKAEAVDKQYLASLTSSQYLTELANRKAAKAAAELSLAQLDSATRVWAKRAIEAGETIDEIDDAIAYLTSGPE